MGCSPAREAGGTGADYTTIVCGGSGSSTTVGAESRIDAYACDPWLELGREKTARHARRADQPSSSE